MSSSPPHADPVAALSLLNQLLCAFDAQPVPDERLDELADELQAAHPLLSLLARKMSDAPVAPELLDELRHNWNKAVRRRGWRRLPAIADAKATGADDAARVREFLALFGLELGAASSPEALHQAAELAGVLDARLKALRGPVLPTPTLYARELAAVAATWNELAAGHPGLPKIE